MSATEFTVTPTAKIPHTCTRCGGNIGCGDTYLRRVTPPWYTGDYFWIVEEVCYICISHTRMTSLDPYRY